LANTRARLQQLYGKEQSFPLSTATWEAGRWKSKFLSAPRQIAKSFHENSHD
jgi:hypothetical protein